MQKLTLLKWLTRLIEVSRISMSQCVNIIYCKCLCKIDWQIGKLFCSMIFTRSFVISAHNFWFQFMNNEYECARLNRHASKRISIFMQIFHASSLIAMFSQLLWIHRAIYCIFMRIQCIVHTHIHCRMYIYIKLSVVWRITMFSSLHCDYKTVWRKQME